MAGEILIGSTTTGLNVYCLIVNPSGEFWNGTAFETYTSANYSTYPIVLVEQGSSGTYLGDFPTTITTGGVYQCLGYSRVGGSPAEGTDSIIGSAIVDRGTTVTSLSTTATGGQMSFLTMQQELSDRVPVFDYTIAADATKLKRWLNMAQRYILSKMNWDFMTGYEIVQTVTDITTGTVSVSAGGTTVTFSSAPTVSVQGRYIQFSSANDWYEITSHTAASTTATIGTAYGQTSNLSAGTYTVRKLLYTTAVPFDGILDMKKNVNPGKLESLSRRQADFFLPLYLQPGNSWLYILAPLNSSGYLQFSLCPPPSDVFNLMIRGTKTFADMVNDSDTTPIPWRWHTALIHMAAFYAFQSVDDTRAADELKMAEIQIADMARVYTEDHDRMRVMAPIDGATEFGPLYTLPANYGRVYL